MSGTFDTLLAHKREETLESFLSLLAGEDLTARAAVARVLSGEARPQGSEYVIPPESLEEMMRVFRSPDAVLLHRMQSGCHPPRPAASDELEEITLPESSAMCTSLLTEMLVSQRGQHAGSAGRWQAAAKAVVFDNFVDDDDDGLAGLPAAPASPSAARVSAKQAENTSAVSKPPCRALCEAPLNTSGGTEEETAGEEEDDDDSEIDLPDARELQHRDRRGNARQTEADMVELRAIVESCENTTAPFLLDPEFDYDANILGTSRRI